MDVHVVVCNIIQKSRKKRDETRTNNKGKITLNQMDRKYCPKHSNYHNYTNYLHQPNVRLDDRKMIRTTNHVKKINLNQKTKDKFQMTNNFIGINNKKFLKPILYHKKIIIRLKKKQFIMLSNKKKAMEEMNLKNPTFSISSHIGKKWRKELDS